jgi:hypothetical protein
MKERKVANELSIEIHKTTQNFILLSRCETYCFAVWEE